MASLLYVTANPKPEQESFSLSVGRAFLEAYREKRPNDQITELDLYNIGIPYIDAEVFSGWGKLQQGTSFNQLSAGEKEKVGRFNELSDQFVQADKYVFVTPLWNLSVPPKMRAYIDTFCIAGKTFKYTETGPVGLLTDKKALHIHASGGIYSEGPAAGFDFGNRYIVALFNFLGIKDVKTVLIEGMAQMPDKAEEIKAKAVEKAKQIANEF